MKFVADFMQGPVKTIRLREIHPGSNLAENRVIATYDIILKGKKELIIPVAEHYVLSTALEKVQILRFDLVTDLESYFASLEQ